MMQRRIALAVVTGILISLPAAAAPNIVLPRPGQVGIGVQGQFGMLAKSGDMGSGLEGDLGKGFSNGPGLGIRLRYRLRYERAIGLSFEGHQLNTRVVLPADTAFSKLSLITSGVEIYQLFGTRDRTTRMLSVGAGLAQPSVEQNDGVTNYLLEDGLYVSAGAGLERFFFRSWAFDLSTRYFAIFQNAKTNHDFQAQAGLIFYASY